MFWLTGRTNRIYFKNWKRFRFRRPAWLVNPLLLLVIAGTLAGATFGFCQILMWQIESLCERRWELSFELKEERGEVKTRQLLLAGLYWSRSNPHTFFYNMKLVNNTERDFTGHLDFILPDCMDITNVRGGKIVISKGTMDSKRKSYEIDLPHVKKRDSITILIKLTSSDFMSETFDVHRILERSTEEDLREFEIPEGEYLMILDYLNDSVRVFGTRWIARIIPDSGFQAEERYMWLYLGLGDDHIRGRTILLDADPNIPPLPSRFFAGDLYNWGGGSSYQGCGLLSEPF